jgi:predicted TPR repeat methyltransferase
MDSVNQDMETFDYSEIADSYDAQVAEYDSYGHDVLFGMSYSHVKENDRILDIGIGTGLSSKNFAKADLRIYGLDESEEMLNACRAKSFAEDLQVFNIMQDRIPYPDRFFDHVIFCGVSHFIPDLRGLFNDVRRVLRDGGIFAFTIAPADTHEDYLKESTAWGVPIFKHSPRYIIELLRENGFELLKEQRLLTKGADKTSYNMLFSAMIARSV